MDNIKSVATTQIKYDSGGDELKKMALASIILNIFGDLKKEKNIEKLEISSMVAKITNSETIASERIDGAIEHLCRNGYCRIEGDNFSLTSDGFERFKDEATARKKRIYSILERHFPSTLNGVDVEKWFKIASAEFFRQYSDRWVEHVCRKEGHFKPGEDIIKTAVKKACDDCGFKDNDKAFEKGFTAFLVSDDREDNAELWSIGQVAFAARLITADVGHDPISIESFRNSNILLDTNVLIAAALEAHRFSNSLLALAKALSQIGCKIGYVPCTKDEYVAAVSRREDDLVRALSYPPQILKKAARDSFLQTALARKCTNSSDVSRMFSSIANPPLTFGDGIDIEEISDKETILAIKIGASNKNRKEDISKTWAKYRGKPKGVRQCEHDAALDSVANSLRARKEPTYILTLDRSMPSLSLKWAGEHTLPTWVGIDVLIQILAVNGLGPTADPSDFGPLLSRMIDGDIRVTERTFTSADFGWLMEVDQRTASLPPEKIEEFAARHARAAMEGTDGAISSVKIEVQRSVYRWKAENDKKLEDTKKAIGDAEKTSKKAEEKATMFRDGMLSTIKRQRRILLTCLYITVGLAGVAASGFFIFESIYEAATKNTANATSIALAVILSFSTVFGLWQWIIPGWKNIDPNSAIFAEERVSDLEKKKASQ